MTDPRALVTELIEVAKVRQREIAEALECDQSTVSDIYRGRTKRIHYQTAEAIKKFHAQRMKAGAA